jgi:hypothetical protein
VLNAGQARTWQRFADQWQEDQPAADAALVPPRDRFQPVRGFGKVWREQLGAAQAAIGWALEPEQAVDGSVQDWEGGLVIWLGAGETLLLLSGGEWQ